jgi:hypothetical protein
MSDIIISKYKVKKFIEDNKKSKTEPKEIPIEFQKLLKIADGDY